MNVFDEGADITDTNNIRFTASLTLSVTFTDPCNNDDTEMALVSFMKAGDVVSEDLIVDDQSQTYTFNSPNLNIEEQIE